MNHNLRIKFNNNILDIINYFLNELGYEAVTIYRSDPDKILDMHYHEEDQTMFIIDGEMEGEIEGKHLDLFPGDEYFFPAKVPHIAKMGPTGCKYLVAVKNGNFRTVFLNK
jgi:quercetin dioxygenase-like cupin family protein